MLHSNETRAPIANPPNSAQLQGTPTIPPSYIQVHAVVYECGEGQTGTQTRVTNIHFASAIRLTRNVTINFWPQTHTANATVDHVKVKVKAFLYSIPSVGPGADPGV